MNSFIPAQREKVVSEGLPKITGLVSGQWRYDAELTGEGDGWEGAAGKTEGAKAGPSEDWLSAKMGKVRNRQAVRSKRQTSVTQRNYERWPHKETSKRE